MDLYGKDKGNISLPQSLQPIDFDETKWKNIIINTQKGFYDLKIAEINKRIQRLEERNRELESNLEDMHYFIKTLEEEKTQEISSLKSQLASYITVINACKDQLITLEKARTDDKYTHIASTINIDEKYKNMRLMLISQIKLLSAKTNILEDYKSIQHILEKKLDMRNQFLINEKEQVAKNLCKIESKFKIDKER
ncbi:hypothetical protein ALC56_12042 [Trachymyrmex septentrionalis]|uniref:Cilia- and flagella-associated protein 157 n=1 Tax=Trachymyrmex septentrionalis TaxID=34720 RepID=A0A195EYX6_9HYME|nr:hypothetical protein ALC56_12042 [Trachymyrmex septentrionalis]